MILNLAAEQEVICRKADVLIVGAGIAGLILATRLRRKDCHIVVLESGGFEQVDEVDPLNQVVQLGQPYRGATHGRFRGLGGTSARWGGALIPFSDPDLADRPYLGLPRFPIEMEAIRPYLPEVNSLFGLDSDSYEEDIIHKFKAEDRIPIGDPDFTARFAKWPRFKRRNLGVLLRDKIDDDPQVEVWLNATVTKFNCDSDAERIRSLEARNDKNGRIIIEADRYILCAGAIESTRLLLLLDQQHEQRIFRHCAALGHFFYDHVSAAVAEIKTKRPIDLNRLAGFRFIGSTMRSLRFELSRAAQEAERIGSAFGHISFTSHQNSGFDALRSLLRRQQMSGRLRPQLMLEVMSDLPYIADAALWRAFHKQLLWPRPATYELHVVVEQLPRNHNRITLASERDKFGLPMAAIDWRIGPEEQKTFDVFTRRFDKYWKRYGLDSVGALDWAYRGGICDPGRLAQAADVFHPGGSTRMGSDHRAAVVDRSLRTFAVTNLWVSSTSVFPSGGGANPTLTLILFTMRLADSLGREMLNRPVAAAAMA